ncbi:MAG: ABC transporter substrate-binding protein [Chitinispirillia bacterium]|nr:ABC transporter substrate-binding protein [Chitinispirillia bacterium]MCL2268157.1 ABC transporter substrate-binding protein [Chitinispirillia bacterium]
MRAVSTAKNARGRGAARLFLALVFPFLAFSAALCLSCDSASGKRAGKQDEYITIGAIFPLTGHYCDEGVRALNGIKQARQEINDAGGVLGKKIDIIVLDDKGDKQRVVEQYNVLKEMGVVAIIGSLFSNVTLPLAEAAAADGMPVISPTASNPEVTKGRKNVFRLIFLDDDQSRIVAGFAHKTLGAKTALIIAGDERFEGMHKVFEEAFKAAGGQVIGKERFTARRDFGAILNKYGRNHPDVIFCATDYTIAAELAEAVNDAGFDGVKLLGTDAWDGILTFAHRLEAMERVYYASPFAFDEIHPAVARFSQRYFDNFSYTPISTAAQSYSAVQILVKAIESAGSTKAEDIIEVMRTGVFDVIAGHMSFDENNNPCSLDASVYIMEIKGGYYRSVEKIRIRERGL